MKHLYVPYEIALKLKEMGCNVPCLAEYLDHLEEGKFELYATVNSRGILSGTKLGWEDSVHAPMYQQVIDWLLSKNYYIEVSSFPVHNGYYGYRYGRGNGVVDGYTIHFEGTTRYDAYNKAILSVLEIFPTKKINLVGK